jgi:hypothetical protein
MKMDFTAKLRVTAKTKGAVAQDSKTMKEAYDIGARLK